VGYAWYDAVSDEVALTVPCGTCAARSGKPCVYVWPHGVNPTSTVRSADTWRLVNRVGRPCKRPHNARRDEIRRRRRQVALSSPVVPANRVRRAAAVAEREFELREYEALRGWLESYAYVLTGGQPPAEGRET